MSVFLHLKRLTTRRFIKYLPLQHKDFTKQLFTKAMLGLDTFQLQSNRVSTQHHAVEDKYKERMKEYLNSPKKDTIFSDDLKTMIYLSKTDDDLKILKEMMIRLHGQNHELRFSTYTFGTVVMRMYCHLGKVDEALDCFRDKKLDTFFDQLMTYQILMDMLFENERYEDLLEVHKVLMEKRLQGVKYPRDILVLVCAACYKMNTSESLQYGHKLFKDGTVAGAFFTGRARDFLRALAMNQQQPHLAAEFSAGEKPGTNQPTYINLQVKLSAAMNEVDDAFAVLDNVMRKDVPDVKREEQIVCEETIKSLREAIQRLNNKPFQNRLDNVEKALRTTSKLTDKNLDYFLLRPIEVASKKGSKGQFPSKPGYRQPSRLPGQYI